MKALLAGLLAVVSLGFASVSVSAAPIQTCSGVHGRTVCGGLSVRPVRHAFKCVYISRLELEIIGWHEIMAGGASTSIGALASGTVVGLPLGAVLAIIGLGSASGGSFIVWYADTYFTPGVYCGYV